MRRKIGSKVKRIGRRSRQLGRRSTYLNRRFLLFFHLNLHRFLWLIHIFLLEIEIKCIIRAGHGLHLRLRSIGEEVKLLLSHRRSVGLKYVNIFYFLSLNRILLRRSRLFEVKIKQLIIIGFFFSFLLFIYFLMLWLFYLNQTALFSMPWLAFVFLLHFWLSDSLFR